MFRDEEPHVIKIARKKGLLLKRLLAYHVRCQNVVAVNSYTNTQQDLVVSGVHHVGGI
jgi:hypothetical protein